MFKHWLIEVLIGFGLAFLVCGIAFIPFVLIL
jgi:hypothetical protein